LQAVFARASDYPQAADPELGLYAGFPGDADKRLFAHVRATPPDMLATQAFAFRDPRYTELLFRYRARNWPATLDADEQARWHDFVQRRLDTSTPLTTLTREHYLETIARLRADPALPSQQLPLLDALEAWERELS
jgi:exodeoxyribonuclease-1